MKKILMVLVIVLVAFGINSLRSEEKYFPDGGDTAEIYISTSAPTEGVEFLSTSAVTANMTICKINFDQLGLSLKKMDNILGIAVHYKVGATTLDKVLSACNGKILKSEQVGDILNYYGYSSNLDGGVTLDGNFINFQVAVTNNGIIVGTPLIMGSY